MESQSQQKTTAAVRQVLMNEMGLTRELVREQTLSIVRTEVEKYMARLVSEGALERLVAEEFKKMVIKDSWNRTRIETLVVEAAKKEAEAFVMKHIQFTPA